MVAAQLQLIVLYEARSATYRLVMRSHMSMRTVLPKKRLVKGGVGSFGMLASRRL